MKTFLTKSPKIAAEFIKKQGVVAFPTETVYGLGANIFDENAIEKIFKAKKRPADNPLIAHVAKLEDIKLLTDEINETAQKLIDEFFPSPLTLVLPKKKEIPLIATAGLPTIGIRMPANKLALEFIGFCQTPLIAPSANLSGKPSPTNWEAVYEDLNSRIDCILQGETTAVGLESTVVDCTGKRPLILRKGAITFENLRKIVPDIEVYSLKKEETPKSPGLKHKHYSPRAKVYLVEADSFVESSPSKAFIGLSRPQQSSETMKICDSVEEYAHEVFRFFRECDRKNITEIYCEIVEEKGLGSALMDRLKRAAEN